MEYEKYTYLCLFSNFPIFLHVNFSHGLGIINIARNKKNNVGHYK